QDADKVCGRVDRRCVRCRPQTRLVLPCEGSGISNVAGGDRPMTAREKLAELIQTLSEEDAVEALDYVQWLLRDEDTLTPEEWDEVRRSGVDLARGDFVTLDELRRDLGR